MKGSWSLESRDDAQRVAELTRWRAFRARAASAAIGASHERWSTVAVAVLIVAVLVTSWFSVFDPIIGVAPDRDSGIFLYIGQQLLQGLRLYRDLFDDKGPLLYLLNAVGLAIGGGSMWGVYLLNLALRCVAGVLVFLGLRHRLGFWAGTATGLYCALLLAVHVYGNSASGLVLLAQLVALFLLTRWGPYSRRVFPYAMLGVAGAAVFFIKMTGVGLWIALLLVETYVALRDSQWRVYRKRMTALTTGASLAVVAVLGYLASSGVLLDFFRVYFRFNAAYASQRGWLDSLRAPLQGAAFLGYVPVACSTVIWMVILIRIVRVWRMGSAPDPLALLALLWFPLEFGVASVPGRGERYFSTVLPVMILLFGLACSEVSRTQPWRRDAASAGVKRRGWLALVLACLAVAGLAPALLQTARSLGGAVVHSGYYLRTQPGAVYPRSCYPEVSEYVRRHTAPGDYVLVWGDYSQATNFFADRRSPTRFVFQPYLYDPGYGDGLVRQFLVDLQTHPPAMIVDTSPSSGPFVERPSVAAVEAGWPKDGPRQFDAAWGEVGRYLRKNYALEEDLPFAPHWMIYIRNSGTANVGPIGRQGAALSVDASVLLADR